LGRYFFPAHLEIFRLLSPKTPPLPNAAVKSFFTLVRWQQ
jgi:hypothetical protein